VNFISTSDIYEYFHLYKLETYTYQPATSPVCKLLYFVAPVGLVGCPVEFLGGIELGIWLVFGYMSSVDTICVCACVCVCAMYTVGALWQNI